MNKAIGLDLGTVTLGIAISDFLGFVHGVETGIKEIALGLPLHMSGEVGERAESALRFKEDLLKEDPTLKIEMVDERLTTVAAHRTLSELDVSSKKRKESVDRLAACGILDTYIRKRGN